MNEIPINVLHDAAVAADLEESAIYENYSGRAMYGEQCFGIVYGNINELLAFVFALPTEYQDLLAETRAASDSMGRSMITYWPALKSGEESYD